MSPPAESRYGKTPMRRNALAPGLLAALVTSAGSGLADSDFYLAIRFAVAILALIVAWFAFEARHWWWLPIFVAIAVLWNPAFPFDFSGPVWIGAHYVAAIAFIIAALLIKKPEGEGKQAGRRSDTPQSGT